MSLFESVILALIQGITEFVPISSSGHLVAVRTLFGWCDEHGVMMDIVLHAASLLAILLYFRKEWPPLILALWYWRDKVRAPERRYVGQLVVATLPVIIPGYLLKDHLDLFRSGMVVGSIMLGTALWFVICETARRTEKPGMTYPSALLMGLAQVVALLPGASRSGLTIGAGVLAGRNRVEAARFSFFMVIPPIAGATLLECRHLPQALEQDGVFLGVLVGFVVCLVASYAAIRFCLSLFRRIPLAWFSLYLGALGLLLMVVDLIR